MLQVVAREISSAFESTPGSIKKLLEEMRGS
jgi:hypothetical protein